MKEENGLSDEDFGDVINVIREIDGVELAITVRQLTDKPEKFKISMRSSGDIKANELCAMFDGGGHVKAAGGMIISDSPENAEYTVIHRILDKIGYEDR
jgi:phosphoesterase RecJ-like protein